MCHHDDDSAAPEEHETGFELVVPTSHPESVDVGGEEKVGVGSSGSGGLPESPSGVGRLHALRSGELTSSPSSRSELTPSSVEPHPDEVRKARLAC